MYLDNWIRFSSGWMSQNPYLGFLMDRILIRSDYLISSSYYPYPFIKVLIIESDWSSSMLTGLCTYLFMYALLTNKQGQTPSS